MDKHYFIERAKYARVYVKLNEKYRRRDCIILLTSPGLDFPPFRFSKDKK